MNSSMAAKESVEAKSEEEENIGLGCALDMFREKEEVSNIIDRLKGIYDDEKSVEATFERFVYILDQYQEQPHLLDSHLDCMLEKLLTLSRNVDAPRSLQHKAFKFLWVITKVRGNKVVVRHLPHEVADMEPVLHLLSQQDPKDPDTWETRYMLLLWLSIVVMIPFHMGRLDNTVNNSSPQTKPVIERILDVIKLYLGVGDKAQDAAAFLASRFITRPDVKASYMSEFLNWEVKMLNTSDSTTMSGLTLQAGVLCSLALLFKHGKREDMKPYGTPMLKKVLECGFKDSKSTVVRKMALKLIQRIGLSFLRVKVASWRYSRGSRSLETNLNNMTTVRQTSVENEVDDDEDYAIPEETEDVIEQLLVGLRDKDTVIRWSAAKGIGRVTGRLPKELADDVVSSVLELFSLREGDSAWHGGCLALAELGRRGLLLPQHLNRVVPVVLKALIYDEVRGSFSVGSHIRDAACYVCWSFARAYDPLVLKPFVNDIASSLVITAVFDREVNCRRAASAAFQENVGRQGTFPHGIEILTAADYFAVGLRQNAFLNLSTYIAQFPEYTLPLIKHLLEHKITHWDTAIRELAAQALHNLTPADPDYMAKKVLPDLLPLTIGMDLNTRHGAILAVAEIIHALSKIGAESGKSVEDLICNSSLHGIRNIIPNMNEKKLFRGLGGILMRTAVSCLIEKAALSSIPFHDDEDVFSQWQNIIDSCIQHIDVGVRSAAVAALPHFCQQYYSSGGSRHITMLESYLDRLKSGQQETLCGCALAIGSLPAFVFSGHVTKVLDGLISCATLTEQNASLAESRRDAIKALNSVCHTVGINPDGNPDNDICRDNISKLYSCFFSAMDDYTLDSRGDIGVIVREAAMVALQEVTQFIVEKDPSLISPSLMSKIICALLQQCVEKIDRTRAIAGNAFWKLLHNSPEIPGIPYREELLQVFPLNVCEQLIWTSPADTFPLFVQLLSLPTYCYSLLLGLTVSVGGLTESLVRHSRASFLSYLTIIRSDPDRLNFICDNLLRVLKNHLKVDRIVLPYFKMIDHLLTSGLILSPVDSDGNSFCEQILNLCWQISSKSRDPQKLIAAVDIFCGCLQFQGACQKRSLSFLAIILCHRFPRIRKLTASKLYEAIVLFNEVVADEVLDDVTTILSETNWDDPLETLRPIRNHLCELLDISPPRTIVNPKGSQS